MEHLHMDMAVNVSHAGHLYTLIHNLCKEAHEGFYTRTADTKHWLDKGEFGFHSDALLVLFGCLKEHLHSIDPSLFYILLPKLLDVYLHSHEVHCHAF